MSIYTDAADLLESDGWVQKAYRVTEEDVEDCGGMGMFTRPGWCMLGALLEADGVDRMADYSKVFQHMQEYAKHLHFAHLNHSASNAFSVMSNWNDAPQRTLPEVLAVLRGEARPDVRDS